MNRTTSVVVLICAAGCKNFGDDAILVQWLKFYEDRDVILISGGSVGEATRASIVEHFSLCDVPEDGGEVLRKKLQGYSRIVVHLTGGGFCNDKLLGASKIFNLMRGLQPVATLIGTGVSFVPLEAASVEVLQQLRFKYLSLRDHASRYGVISSLYPVLGDDLLPYFFFRKTIPPGDRKNLFINIQNQFDAKGQVGEIALRIRRIAEKGNYERLFVCEFSEGDLDILEHLPEAVALTREEVYQGKLAPRVADHFIGTRFHFRMLMEYAGASGIVIVVDKEYYGNKHEGDSAAVNFIPGRSTVVQTGDFLSESVVFPEWKHRVNRLVYMKRLETALVRLLVR